MCVHGDTVDIDLLTCAEVAHHGEDYRRVWPIDRCIAPLVAALDVAGVAMLGSCCGHGKAPGEILLRDGRSIVVDAVLADRERTP